MKKLVLILSLLASITAAQAQEVPNYYEESKWDVFKYTVHRTAKKALMLPVYIFTYTVDGLTTWWMIGGHEDEIH